MNTKKYHLLSAKHSTGRSLVELMISLTLFSTLPSLYIGLISPAIATSTIETQAGYWQDNSSTALLHIEQDVRMAGFGGCATPAIFGAPTPPPEIDRRKDTVANTMTAAAIYHAERGHAGFDAIGPHHATRILQQSQPQSDILVTRRATHSPISVLQYSSNSQELSFTLDSADENLQKENHWILTDCHNSLILTPQVVALNNKLLLTADHNKNDLTDIPTFNASQLQALPLNTIVYYTRKNPADIPALYRVELGKNAQEITDNIVQANFNTPPAVTASTTSKEHVITAIKATLSDAQKNVNSRTIAIKN